MSHLIKESRISPEMTSDTLRFGWPEDLISQSRNNQEENHFLKLGMTDGTMSLTGILQRDPMEDGEERCIVTKIKCSEV